MGTETRVTRTCDRCEKEWATTDATRQPTGSWGTSTRATLTVSLRVHFPPHDSETECLWDFCPDCESTLARWLYGEVKNDG